MEETVAKIYPAEPAGGAAIISTEKLTKVYDAGEVRVDALQEIDLCIQKGEMVAVMGPSGCGKTTLLNCLSGIDEPTTGKVHIQDQDLYKLRDRARTNFRARKMGFIFQSFNLLPVLSVSENVELPLLVAGVNPSLARNKAAEGLDMLGLADQSKKRPAELSGGQQQRVAIARALVNDPDIVWCDEPTGNLDSETAEQIMDVLCRLNREKQQTFVVVTHSDEVGERTDRVIRMRDGRIQGQDREMGEVHG